MLQKNGGTGTKAMGRTGIFFFVNSGCGMLCTRPTRKLDFYSASSLKQQSRIDMSSHLDTLS